MNKIEVLPSEFNLLKQELEYIETEREEIRNLWLTANEQWSETFGHDNPILEAKAEKERLLASKMKERWNIPLQIQQCFIISESDVKERKEQDIILSWEVQWWLGSIYTLKYKNQAKELRWIMTWLIQWKKIEFDWHLYASFSPETDLWKALLWKSKWESWSFVVWWKNNIEFTILDIE